MTIPEKRREEGGETKDDFVDERSKVATPANRPRQLPGQPKAPPAVHPSFTMKDLRDAIPPHCFERSTLKSLAYLVVDMAVVAGAMYAASYIETLPLPWVARAALWCVYFLVAGNVMTGIWVIAHECGHQAFSDSAWINNTVGTVLHSALLVPYHPWRISHANHHKNCCSVEHDEVFVPSPRSAVGEALEESPISSIWGIFVMLTFGWPMYLISNVVGPAKYQGKVNDHFSPWSALFQPSQFWLVVQSDLVFMAVIAGLLWIGNTIGWQALAAYYGVPYLLVNCNLVLITYLQHTDTYIPHFREGAFTSLRGKLSTVDRSWGFIDTVWHHINDTHVVHHIFSTMPHYHAQEATDAIRSVLGPYYLRDDTPIHSALYRSWRHCRAVPDHGDIVYYEGASSTPASKTD